MAGSAERDARVATVDCKTDGRWLELTLEALRVDGCAIVTGVLDDAFLDETRRTMRKARDEIRAAVGHERLARAGELGVLRIMLEHDAHFFRFLELPEVLGVVDATVGETAILHLQNGLMLPPVEGDTPDVFQLRFHRDFPRILNRYLMSVNTFFAIDEFSRENGGTLLVPGTHQLDPAPPERFLQRRAVAAVCPAGSMIVFDSTLQHAAGENRSDRERIAVNHQFTRSYVKQQIDYVRALGEERVLAQAPRTQQLLGWYTRVVTSLEEYYRPAEERLYRSGQG